METYLEFKERRQKEISEFPMVFAFNNKQFAEGMKKLGLSVEDTDKACSIPGGGFMRKTDAPKLTALLIRHVTELDKAFASDETGNGFMYEAFTYELANHEYCISGDPTDALAVLGLTMDDVESNPVMLKAFMDARARQGMNG